MRPPSCGKMRLRDPRVLVLTTYDTDGDVLPAIESGATGYLPARSGNRTLNVRCSCPRPPPCTTRPAAPTTTSNELKARNTMPLASVSPTPLRRSLRAAQEQDSLPNVLRCSSLTETIGTPPGLENFDGSVRVAGISRSHRPALAPPGIARRSPPTRIGRPERESQ